MIKLVIDSIVENTLQAAFPKPAKSANKAITKYVKTLEHFLNMSELRGITPENFKLNTYSVALKRFREKTPQIGSDKLKVHVWLRENNLSLLQTVREGAKFGPNKGISIVKPTSLVTIIDVDERLEPEEAFARLHPKFPKSAKKISADYDCSPVDIVSLNNYIQTFNNGNRLNNKQKSAVIQAKRIVAAALYKNGVFYQKKKLSNFGRIYYTGLSVQNISKKTREAMLGDCYEYDMKSSVVAWKLGYAQTYLDDNNLTHSVKDEFPQCYQYWDDKSVLIDDIRKDVFKHPSAPAKSNEKQIKLIKQAMTAFNFGAKRSAGYTDKLGCTQEQAIGKILKHKLESASFLGHQRVIGYVEEQKRLNATITKLIKINNPKLLADPILLTEKGNLRPQSLLSYLYQNAETEVMNIVREYAKIHNLTVLANIHDAIIFRDPLDPTLQQLITQEIHTRTGNTYWELNETKLNRTP